MTITKKIIFVSLLIHFSVVAQKAAYADWMSEHLDQNLALKQITLPGAHDATIYRCFDCTVGANVKNTQTQYLPIETLLDSGIRYFDVRPVYDEGEFYTGHYTKYHKRPSFGCKGDSLQRVLSEVNKFLGKHNELVILHFSHYCDREWGKANKNYLPGLLELLRKTLPGKILMLSDSTERLADIPLNKLLSGSTGKVILLFNDYNGKELSNKREGLFSFQKDLTAIDSYSNTTDFEFMRDDQLRKFEAWKMNKKEELFVMPWTLTQNAKSAMRCSGFKCPWQKSISIMEYAATAKKYLPVYINEWIQKGIITKENKPNIVNVDIADGLVTRLCIQMNTLDH